MPHLLKPKFEQLRHEVLGRLKPMREAEVAAIQAKMVDFLNDLGDVLVERARRPNRTDPLLEINGAWMGPASSHKEIGDLLKEQWPGTVLDGLDHAFHLENIEEMVVLRFVGTTDERYLTGRVQIRT